MLGSVFGEIFRSLLGLQRGGNPPWIRVFYRMLLLFGKLLCCGPLPSCKTSILFQPRKATGGTHPWILHFTYDLLTQKSDCKISLVIQLRKGSDRTKGGRGFPKSAKKRRGSTHPMCQGLPRGLASPGVGRRPPIPQMDFSLRQHTLLKNPHFRSLFKVAALLRD